VFHYVGVGPNRVEEDEDENLHEKEERE